jgi:hypothetical protein
VVEMIALPLVIRGSIQQATGAGRDTGRTRAQLRRVQEHEFAADGPMKAGASSCLRLIPLSQVDQYLGLAGRSETGLGSTFSGGLDRSARMPLAVRRRRGSRRTVGSPLRGLSRPTISQ